MKKSLLIRIFSSVLVTSLAAVGLSAPAQASGPNYLVTTAFGSVIAGGTRTFVITATTDGSTIDTGYSGSKAVVINSTPAGATFAAISDFTSGVATVAITFSAAGSFTVSAMEGGESASRNGISSSISVAAIDSVAILAATGLYEDADIGTPTTANVTAANNLRVTVQGLLNELVEGGWPIQAIGEVQNPVNVKTAVVAQAAVILYQALPLRTLAEVTAAETFGLVTQDLVTAILTFGFGTQVEVSANLDSQAKVDTKDGLVAAARLALTPAASTPSRPVDDGAWQQNLQTISTPVPGFFSGQKWTISKDDDGVSTVWISLAESHAGKTAKIYKRTIKGKLFLLGEQRLGKIGKNARTVLETDKPLRTGQKVRVQVDGTFRSTVTMP